MSVVGNGRPVDNRQHHHHHHHQQHRIPSSMPIAAPPPPQQQHQPTMMVSTVPEHGTPRPDQQVNVSIHLSLFFSPVISTMDTNLFSLIFIAIIDSLL